MQTETITQTAERKPHSLVASDRVEGTPVRRADGTKVGTIKRLMIDKISGKVAYAVLEFGGFIGMGAKHIPVPWERMRYNAALMGYEMNVTAEELAKAPSYEADKDFDWGDRSGELDIHAYYRATPYWGAY
ncbi:MAG: PRC-barrel domain-containing protein [Rhizobiales bacterium]|nr:PRC-barrel domain-containing protein [Hyphomicrobiales bacterium]